MKKTRHDGDCTIYASLVNNHPEDGICTCGYGWQCVRQGDFGKMYSDELRKMLEGRGMKPCRLSRAGQAKLCRIHSSEDYQGILRKIERAESDLKKLRMEQSCLESEAFENEPFDDEPVAP